MLIDTHAHVHFLKEFPDFEEVLLRARQAGVLKQVMIGCNIADSLAAAKFVNNRDGLSYVAGIHPHDAGEVTAEDLQKLRDLIMREGDYEFLSKSPVAIGEIGLDYFRNKCPVEVQKKAFRELLELAKEFNLPVVVHIRDAFVDAMEILSEAGNKKVVLHCFTGSLVEAEVAWNRGYLVSFTGTVTYPKNDALREVVLRAPESQFMVETDCPFLAPQKYRGQRCEPAFVAETARFIAELRVVRAEEIAEITTANSERFFGI